MRCAFLLLLALPLAACGSSSEPGPGGVAPDEAQALDEAAEMIEQRRLPAEALRSSSATQSAVPSPAPTAPPP